jgi:flagellar biogenesis protein FliO
MKHVRWIALALLMACAAFATIAHADSAPLASPSPPADSLEHRPIARDGAVAGSSRVPSPANPAKDGFDPARVVLALAGVLALILILRTGLRRIFPGAISHRATRAIKILSRSVVSPKQHLLLIQVGKRLVVVGDSGAQLNPLCEIADEEEVAAILSQVREESATAARRFDLLFGRARKEIEEDHTPAPAAAPCDAAFDPTHEINDPALIQTQNELTCLSEKARELARQLRDA